MYADPVLNVPEYTEDAGFCSSVFKVGAGIPEWGRILERVFKRSCIKTKAFQLTAFGAKVSRSPSLLLQRLALSLVPELRRLEYQWVGLAKFKTL